MNKYLKYILGVVGLYIVLMAAFGIYSVHSSVQKNDYVLTKIQGTSMYPTLMEGDSVKMFSNITPKPGDIVSFECYTVSCLNGDSITDSGRTKRLIKINEQGCYWFEGDNQNHSWDSRGYGWLCPPSDVKILGVIIK